MGKQNRLKLIAEKAKQDKIMKFTSLSHLINEKSLAWSYFQLQKEKASGVDGVTWRECGFNLEENLKDLVERMKQNRYRPQPVKRVFIPINVC